jgi:hypothetical protein
MKMTGEELRDLAEGTAVRVLFDSGSKFHEGETIYRHKHDEDCSQSCKFRDANLTRVGFMTHEEVELIVDDQVATTLEFTPAETVIARPVLEERKIGKIAIELFDHGFPNAIMAVGEVMTWAAEHKGYKPHDWKNLPNAETAFDAAGSRHRIKRHIQSGRGLTPEFRTDEESDLLHLAHEAFNVLAQLELTITGKIA